MHILPPWLRQLFKKKEDGENRAFGSEVVEVELTQQDTQAGQLLDIGERDENQVPERSAKQDFEIYPEDPAVRKQWFSLTVRERQVVALVCMGYRNYEIGTILGVSYPTIQTHLQKIFRKFGLRSRNEIRSALLSWSAEEWWNHHHY
jgi:DNA-binding CsgD family transcriptional regulator